MKKAVAVTTQEALVAVVVPVEQQLVVLLEVVPPKEVNQDLHLLNRELVEHNRDQIVPLEVQVEDSVELTVDLETLELVAEDLVIVPLEVAKVKLNEAAESIDILKDRQFQ
jgi:hypothetical protein